MVLAERRKVKTYFSAIGQKKSLAEPVDFFHHNGNEVLR
jgi:hypothetical protein